MKKKELSYEEVYQGFLDRGLQLDILKEDFVDRYTKMKCHCIKHPQTDLYYSWQYVRLGRFSCKDCNKENPQYHKYLSIEERIEFINNNTRFTYISGMTNKILDTIIVSCDKGHQFSTNYNSLKRGKINCPFCDNKLPSDYWNVKTCQEWLNINNINYTILDFKRLSSGNKVKIHCGNPKHKSYWTAWSHIQEGTRCKECYYEQNNKTDWTLERAKEYLKTFSLKMIDESQYVSSHKRIPCEDNDGFIYMVSIHYLNRNRTVFSLWKGNPYVVHNIKLFCKLYRPDYEFLSDKYYGNKYIHKWKYTGDFYDNKEHIREFDMKFGSFINNWCKHPDLSKSQLEIECIRILKKYKVNYIEQKTFNNCVYKIKLRFDFYLTDYNVCIETDGTQHIIPVEKWGGMEALRETIIRDNIKNKYCEDNNISLIRIPYNKIRHMEEVLLKELQALSINLESA